jgi:hypothetical protein
MPQLHILNCLLHLRFVIMLLVHVQAVIMPAKISQKNLFYATIVKNSKRGKQRNVHRSLALNSVFVSLWSSFLCIFVLQFVFVIFRDWKYCFLILISCCGLYLCCTGLVLVCFCYVGAFNRLI